MICQGERAVRHQAGAMPGQVMTPKQVATLATMPSPRGTAGKTHGHHAGADRQFVRHQRVPGKFVRTLAAVRDQKQAA